MRTLSLLSFIVLAVIATVFAFVSPAAAQSGSSDPCSNGSAIRARSEGSYSPPPRIFVPPAFETLKLSFRFAFARYLSLSSLPTRTLDFPSSADLPSRRRSL
jgi:hypothetical protein